MVEAQAEFDARAGAICPSQLTAPVLHKVLTYPALQPLIWYEKLYCLTSYFFRYMVDVPAGYSMQRTYVIGC